MLTAAILCTETAIGWVALCEDLPGICGLGDDEDEAMDDLTEAIAAHLRSVTIH